ncbi:MAG: hypothetical protein Q9174_005472 [Haloplaca sp. 1 TL-2023]
MSFQKKQPTLETDPESPFYIHDKKEDSHSNDEPSRRRAPSDILNENLSEASAFGEIYMVWLQVETQLDTFTEPVVPDEHKALYILRGQCRTKLQELIEPATPTQMVEILRDFCTLVWPLRFLKMVTDVMVLLFRRVREPALQAALEQDKAWKTLVDDRHLWKKLGFILDLAEVDDKGVEKEVERFLRDMRG